MPWNILQPITFFPWKPLPQPSPSPLPEDPFAQAIWEWHNHSDCQQRSIFFTPISTPVPATWCPSWHPGTSQERVHPHPSVKTVQPFISSPPGRWQVCPSTVTAQPQSGSWHLHVPKSGCLTKYSGALNWRELVFWSWGEAALAVAQLTMAHQCYPHCSAGFKLQLVSHSGAHWKYPSSFLWMWQGGPICQGTFSSGSLQW